MANVGLGHSGLCQSWEQWLWEGAGEDHIQRSVEHCSSWESPSLDSAVVGAVQNKDQQSQREPGWQVTGWEAQQWGEHGLEASGWRRCWKWFSTVPRLGKRTVEGVESPVSTKGNCFWNKELLQWGERRKEWYFWPRSLGAGIWKRVTFELRFGWRIEVYQERRQRQSRRTKLISPLELECLPSIQRVGQTDKMRAWEARLLLGHTGLYNALLTMW